GGGGADSPGGRESLPGHAPPHHRGRRAALGRPPLAHALDPVVAVEREIALRVRQQRAGQPRRRGGGEPRPEQGAADAAALVRRGGAPARPRPRPPPGPPPPPGLRRPAPRPQEAACPPPARLE